MTEDQPTSPKDGRRLHVMAFPKRAARERAAPSSSGLRRRPSLDWLPVTSSLHLRGHEGSFKRRGQPQKRTAWPNPAHPLGAVPRCAGASSFHINELSHWPAPAPVELRRRWRLADFLQYYSVLVVGGKRASRVKVQLKCCRSTTAGRTEWRPGCQQAECSVCRAPPLTHTGEHSVVGKY